MSVLPKNLQDEITLALGVAYGIAEALVQVFATGTVHDLLTYAIAVAALLHIRARVVPVSKLAQIVRIAVQADRRLSKVAAIVPAPEAAKPPAKDPVAAKRAPAKPAAKPAPKK